MDRVALPAHRKLGAGNEGHGGVARGSGRFGQAAGIVVVGQRIEIDATRGGSLHDLCGR